MMDAFIVENFFKDKCKVEESFNLQMEVFMMDSFIKIKKVDKECIFGYC